MLLVLLTLLSLISFLSSISDNYESHISQLYDTFRKFLECLRDLISNVYEAIVITQQEIILLEERLLNYDTYFNSLDRNNLLSSLNQLKSYSQEEIKYIKGRLDYIQGEANIFAKLFKNFIDNISPDISDVKKVLSFNISEFKSHLFEEIKSIKERLYDLHSEILKYMLSEKNFLQKQLNNSKYYTFSDSLHTTKFHYMSENVSFPVDVINNNCKCLPPNKSEEIKCENNTYNFAMQYINECGNQKLNQSQEMTDMKVKSTQEIDLILKHNQEIYDIKLKHNQEIFDIKFKYANECNSLSWIGQYGAFKLKTQNAVVYVITICLIALIIVVILCLKYRHKTASQTTPSLNTK